MCFEMVFVCVNLFTAVLLWNNTPEVNVLGKLCLKIKSSTALNYV